MHNILFVNSRLAGGGSEKVMVELANEFCRRGYQVSMALLRNTDNEIYILDSKIKRYQFYYSTNKKIFIGSKRIFMLRKIIKKGRYDAIISFMYDINRTTLTASLGLRQRIIISERADPSVRKRRIIQKIIDDWLMRKAYKIVFQTEKVKNMMGTFLQDKCVVIPNPISASLPDPYFGDRVPIIVSAGRLTEQKNFGMLINAFSSIHKVYPEIKLAIYGKGLLEEELKRQVNDLGVETDVIFHGYVQNFPMQIRNALMYIQSSLYEGMSNALIEAMSLGLPVIATDCPVGGERMIIKDGVNGFLIKPNDIDELVSKITFLIKNPDVASKIGENATLIRKKLSIDKIVNQWIKIIE